MISKEKILHWIKKFHNTNKKVPRRINIKDYISPTTVDRKFGSWNNAIIAAKLKPNHISTKAFEIRCPNCNKIIKKRNKDLKRSKSGNLFCTISCSTIYNNKKRPKKLPRFGVCKCGKKLPIRNKFCKTCHPNYVDWDKRTLADLQKLGTFNKHRYLRDHSLRTFKQSDNDYICLNCRYNKHVDICHLKEVQKFKMKT